MLVLEFQVRARDRVNVRAGVRDRWGYETPAYEKVRVRNVWKPYRLHPPSPIITISSSKANSHGSWKAESSYELQ